MSYKRVTNVTTIKSAAAQRELEALAGRDRRNSFISLCLHWPEYLMEAGELCAYMFLACVFATLLQHPASRVRHLIPSATSRRVIMGLLMGTTMTAIVMTPWGKQSGGHFNPAITFTFFRLGKLQLWDAMFYAVAQFSGALCGVVIASYILRGALEDDAVRYAVTVPGAYGRGPAFFAELMISFVLMITVLIVSNRDSLARRTPYFVGALYAIFIIFEAPLSGMSMNPARTFGSAFSAGIWDSLWIYFAAPTLGMLIAAEAFLRFRGGVHPYCAKLHHANDKRCIFHCGYQTQSVSRGQLCSGQELSNA